MNFSAAAAGYATAMATTPARATRYLRIPFPPFVESAGRLLRRLLFGIGSRTSLVVIDKRARYDPRFRTDQIGHQTRELIRFDQLSHRLIGFCRLEPIGLTIVEPL